MDSGAAQREAHGYGLYSSRVGCSHTDTMVTHRMQRHSWWSYARHAACRLEVLCKQADRSCRFLGRDEGF